MQHHVIRYHKSPDEVCLTGTRLYKILIIHNHCHRTIKNNQRGKHKFSNSINSQKSSPKYIDEIGNYDIITTLASTKPNRTFKIFLDNI